MPQPEPESPCTHRCALEPETDICLGCHRTLAEIENGWHYSVEEKLEVLRQTERRKRARNGKL